jgi:hypothetical protein
MNAPKPARWETSCHLMTRATRLHLIRHGGFRDGFLAPLSFHFVGTGALQIKHYENALGISVFMGMLYTQLRVPTESSYYI